MIAADLTSDLSAEERPAKTATPFRSAARRAGRKTNDVLGLAWLHGTLQAEVFRRQVSAGGWESPTAVHTIEEFEAGLDTALEKLEFSGTEVFLILEHDQFVHQAEHAPSFSDSAAHAFLRGRVQRYEKEREPVIWISQRTVSMKQDSAFLLHLLPTVFHARLCSFLVTRHLDLTRIIPLVVPLQLLLEETPLPKEQMVLMAAAAGDATTLMVARGNGELLFSRTMLARWEADPARIAVEVNRSLLYAKQQFGAVVDRIELVGMVSEQVKAEVHARCGVDKQLTVRPTNVRAWLQAVAGLSARHPVNLVVAYLARKRRRQFFRQVLLAVCWLGLGLASLDAWSRRQAWTGEQLRLERLQANQSEWTMERDELRRRKSDIRHQREIIRQAADERLPSVAPRFLAYLGSIRSTDTQFTGFLTKWDAESSAWTFRLEGRIDADEETAGETLSALQRALERSPLRVRFNDAVRVMIAQAASGPDVSSSHRFIIEGGLFEN